MFQKNLFGRLAKDLNEVFEMCINIIDKGKIVESGKHENLLGHNKIYADLWNVQVGI